MAPCPVERLMRIHDLDLQYERGIHRAEHIYRDEDLRRTKLRILAARDENAALRDKSIQKDRRNRHVARQHRQVCAELDQVKEAARSQDTKLKKQNVDLASLRAENDSLGNSMQDSGKILQEKFALVRELDRIRPELEHLNSQLANHQTVVAEKHRLQRQLDTLEVELENEKRSRQRARDKDERAAMDELRARADEAERRLASVKREQVKARGDHEKQASEAQAHAQSLEDSILAMRTKLKETQSELKETREAMDQYRAELDRAQDQKEMLNPGPAQKARRGRKRAAEDSSLEAAAIDTPGNDSVIDKRPIKKRGVERAAYGEKSTFSITPFLNRSKSLPDSSIDIESPDAAESERPTSVPRSPNDADEPEAIAADDQIAMPMDAFEPEDSFPAKARVAKTKITKGRPKSKVSTEPSMTGSTVTKPARLAKEVNMKSPPKGKAGGQRQMGTTLERSSSQAKKPAKPKSLEELEPPADEGFTAAANIDARGGDGEGKKKRRKVLGAPKSIFDDEDEEIAPPAAKVQVGHKRKLSKTVLGGVPNAFAGSTFSPLKRERRGVNASFLA